MVVDHRCRNEFDFYVVLSIMHLAFLSNSKLVT